jgi:exopolysaccharide production protein ExoQ
MPPLLALLVGLAFIVYLLRIDSRQSKDGSSALWIPLSWMFFGGSRFLSQWLSVMGVPVPGADAVDGSPLDRVVFFFLMAAAIVVLRRRRVDWPRVFFDNKWIWLYFAFGLVSVLWSAEPMMSFRRVPKAAGNVLMAMVILTEPRPSYGLASVLRRLAYLTLPLSVVFNRYFPQLSRAYSNHIGNVMFSGVGTQKNSLGELCLLAGMYCVWDLLYVRDQQIRALGGLVRVEWIVAGLVAWLMATANSATALACMAVASAVLVLGRTGLTKSPTGMVVVVSIAGLSAIAADSLFGLFSIVITALGRQSDLTTRVPMWEQLLATAPGSSAFGVGFEAYWSTASGRGMTDVWNVANAHNGYVDAYLSSGYIGLGLILLSVVSAIIKVARRPPEDMAGASLWLAAIMTVVLYNWTESAFRTVSPVWVLFLVAGLDIHTAVVRATESASRARPVEATGPISIHAWRRLKQGDGVVVESPHYFRNRHRIGPSDRMSEQKAKG